VREAPDLTVDTVRGTRWQFGNMRNAQLGSHDGSAVMLKQYAPNWSDFLVETPCGAVLHCGFLSFEVSGWHGVKPSRDRPQNASEEHLRQAVLLTLRGQPMDTCKLHRRYPMRAMLELAWTSILDVAHDLPQIQTRLDALDLSSVGRRAAPALLVAVDGPVPAVGFSATDEPPPRTGVPPPSNCTKRQAGGSGERRAGAAPGAA